MTLQAATSQWGRRMNSKDYEPLMRTETSFSEPQSILETTLTNIGQNLTDRVKQMRLLKVNGQIIEREETLRTSNRLNVTGTVGFPNTIDHRLRRRIEQNSGCEESIYLRALCQTNEERHAYIFDRATFDQPIFANDVQTIDDTQMIEFTADFEAVEIIHLLEGQATEQKVLSDRPLYDVAFKSADCIVCGSGDLIHSALVATGGTGPGVDLITNGDFAAATGWTLGDGMTVTGGVLDVDGTQSSTSDATQDVGELSVEFEVSFDIVTRTAGTVAAIAGTSVFGSPVSAIGSYSQKVTASGGTTVGIQVSVDFEGTIDNVVVRRTDQLQVLNTTDRFASWSYPTNMPAPAGSIGSCIYTQGDLVVIGFSDVAKTADLTTGTTGGTIVSADGGETFQLDNNLAVGIYGMDRLGRYYVAGGGNATAKLYLSTNGLDWTEVVDATLNAAEPVTDVAVDEERGRVYIVTHDGKLFLGAITGSTLNITELTPPNNPTKLTSIAVYDSNHVAIGGDSYYDESEDGGVTWLTPAFTGTSDVYIDGHIHRTFLGSGSAMSKRDILTDFQFKAVTVTEGKTVGSNVTAFAIPQYEYLTSPTVNISASVTDGGEIFIIKDPAPFNL